MAGKRARAMVRPRWVWAGTATGVLALVVLGVAASIRSWWWAGVGTVLLVAGVAAARRGRIMHDVHGVGRDSGSAEGEVERVQDGGREPGVRPGDMIEDPEVKQHSREVEAEHRRAIEARPARVSMAPAGGILMLCAALLLVAAQLSMFPNTRLGEENATFSIAPAALLAIAGLNAVGRPEESHRLAGMLGLVGGLAVLLVALLNPHQAVGTEVVQATCGAVGILGALPLLGALTPRTR